MFERYTAKARRAIFFAQYAANHQGDPPIKPAHLLWGLLHEGDEPFSELKVSKKKLQAMRKSSLGPAALKFYTARSGLWLLPQESRAILERACREMRARRHKEIDIGHLLLAMLHVPSTAKDMLYQQNLSYEQVSALLPFEPPNTISSGDAAGLHLELLSASQIN